MRQWVRSAIMLQVATKQWAYAASDNRKTGELRRVR